MKYLSRALAIATLAVAGTASHAAVVFSTPAFAGDVTISGFGAFGPGMTLPNTKTFTVSYTNLSGSLNFQALPNGHYTVSAGGTYEITGFGPTAFGGTVPVTPVYSGYLGSTGLTPGDYSFGFGSPRAADIPFFFELDYDGNASSQVMAALTGLGFGFVNPDGAGKLKVVGTFFDDGTSATLVFTESDLTWTGFANMLAMADAAGSVGGLGNGVMDGSFRLTDITVTAVPEPGSLALVGAALLGLGAMRRRSRG